jgi:hypothetical protein
VSHRTLLPTTNIHKHLASAAILEERKRTSNSRNRSPRLFAVIPFRTASFEFSFSFAVAVAFAVLLSLSLVFQVRVRLRLQLAVRWFTCAFDFPVSADSTRGSAAGGVALI